MSLVSTPLRHHFLSLLAAGAAASTFAFVVPNAASAASAPATVKYDVPSTQGNVDVKRVQFNEGTKSLTAWVRLPAGYEDQPDRTWPVLYLLHGWEDSSDGWLQDKKGALNSVLPADFPGIVVMPEGAKGWFVNWADDKANPGRQWGDYLLDEVVPFMEKNLRIAPGRANHAIGGLSMGGYGGVQAVRTFPTYFGHALSFSGLLDNQDLSFSTIVTLAQFGSTGYNAVFGSPFGTYAGSVNPIRNAREFAGSRLSITYGTPNISAIWSLDLRVRAEATLEVGAQGQARKFVSALKGTNTAVFTNNRPNGAHSWGWWKLDFADAVKRGIFNPPPITETSQARDWDYSTMNDHGNAWGIGYQFQGKPTTKIELSRRGQELQGKGKGTIRISGGAADADSSGNGSKANCTYTLKLPFYQILPEGC